MSITNIPVSNDQALDATQRPPWLDEQLYPFQSHYIEVEGNRIHFIDEGSGPTLLLLHLGVGWSFMYSDIIQELRCSSLATWMVQSSWDGWRAWSASSPGTAASS